jgi:hypothetical protein
MVILSSQFIKINKHMMCMVIFIGYDGKIRRRKILKQDAGKSTVSASMLMTLSSKTSP